MKGNKDSLPRIIPSECQESYPLCVHCPIQVNLKWDALLKALKINKLKNPLRPIGQFDASYILLVIYIDIFECFDSPDCPFLLFRNPVVLISLS